MPIRKRPTLLLDLDGTLVDPADGIISGVRFALDTLGVGARATDDLRWVIGPSIRDSFRRLLHGTDDVEQAVRLYRQKYSTSGLYQAAVYPGVPDVLESLSKGGTRLLVCTAKASPFAHRVVDHFGLAPFLSGLYGSELDGRFEDKGDLIAHLLEVENLRPEDTCMVGDRKHDVIAAAKNGIPTVGVLWGYGGHQELTSAGAALLIDRPEDLLADVAL